MLPAIAAAAAPVIAQAAPAIAGSAGPSALSMGTGAMKALGNAFSAAAGQAPTATIEKDKKEEDKGILQTALANLMKQSQAGAAAPAVSSAIGSAVSDKDMKENIKPSAFISLIKGEK